MAQSSHSDARPGHLCGRLRTVVCYRETCWQVLPCQASSCTCPCRLVWRPARGGEGDEALVAQLRGTIAELQLHAALRHECLVRMFKYCFRRLPTSQQLPATTAGIHGPTSVLHPQGQPSLVADALQPGAASSKVRVQCICWHAAGLCQLKGLPSLWGTHCCAVVAARELVWRVARSGSAPHQNHHHLTEFAGRTSAPLAALQHVDVWPCLTPRCASTLPCQQEPVEYGSDRFSFSTQEQHSEQVSARRTGARARLPCRPQPCRWLVEPYGPHGRSR